MTSTLNIPKASSLGEVLEKSNEAMIKLQTSLDLQKNRVFLAKQSLPPLPQDRAVPLIVNVAVNKNNAKRVGNEVHNKFTNGGFSRTSYGGFYMH